MGLLILLFGVKGWTQDSLQTVVAKNGDGIFSMLRNEGIDIVKYYAKFVELNAAKIENGSHLAIGVEYQIPNAPDSFKNMGRNVQWPDGVETAIFEGKLASLKKRDSSLKNTVYYLVSTVPNREDDHKNGRKVARTWFKGLCN